ncbi:MAG: type IV pilus secretin PilQ [Desulfobacterales bacterium]|nr:type IV pilus secretin PilQ [Desulfobacterales bacterium]
MKKNHTAIPMRIAAAVALVVLLTAIGCVQQKELKKDPFFEDWRIRAEEAKGYSPSANAPLPKSVPAGSREEGITVADALPEAGAEPAETPPRAMDVAAKNPVLPTLDISLKVKDVEIATLLRVLARAAGQNILISQNVKGTATVSVSEMPWDKVFQGILNTNGLTFAWEGDILRIITLKDLQAEIQMMEARQEKNSKEKEYQLQMNSLQTRARMDEPLRTWVYHVRYADTKTLRDNLDQFFQSGRVGTDWTASGNGQGKGGDKVKGAILVDTHTNSLVIQAVQSDIDRLKETVRLLDVPTRQVLIEAYIVQATDSAARELGVQWGGAYKTSDGGVDHYVTSGATSSGGVGSGLATAVDPTAGNAVNFPIATSSAAGGFTLGYLSQNIGQHLLSVQLSALETEGRLNILSRPSITTLDNQEAIIESGKEIPFQSVDNQNVKIEYKDAVLSLKVKPYVVDNQTLKLEIDTKKDEPDFANTVGGQPTITTRKAKTTVVLFNGQTTVIGGLSERKATDSENGVPFLKDIPLIGRLFKKNIGSNNLDELLIFITPHILQERIVPTATQGPPPAPPAPDVRVANP